MGLLKTYICAARALISDTKEDRARVDEMRSQINAQKIIREDQLHAVFLVDEASPFAAYFARMHEQAIAAMRNAQAHSYMEYAERGIREDEILEAELGFFPDREVVVTVKYSDLYEKFGKVMGVRFDGVQESLYSTDAQRPVFKYARLGEWLKIWDNFTPVSNLKSVERECMLGRRMNDVEKFWQRIDSLPNHAELFEHSFELQKGSSWPNPHDPDCKKDVEVGPVSEVDEQALDAQII